MKLEHFIMPYTEINSKWIIDLNVSPETIKLLEEYTGRTFDYISQNKIFYDTPPRVMKIKTKIIMMGQNWVSSVGGHFKDSIAIDLRVA